jgi:hypothetical protein
VPTGVLELSKTIETKQRNSSMPRFIQYTIFLTLFSFSLLGQPSPNLDSLRQSLAVKTTTLDSAFINIELANYYIYHNLDSATTYIDVVLDGVEKDHFVLPDTFYKHLLIKAWTHQGKQEFTQAKAFLREALVRTESCKRRDTKLELLMNYSSLLVQTRDSSAMRFIDRELPRVDTTLGKSDYIMYSILHQHKSRIYAQQDDYENAIKILLYVAGERFLKEVPGYRYGVRTSLSEYLAYMGDRENAIKQLHLVLEDTLYNYQRKDIYHELCRLNITKDSLETAQYYLDTYWSLSPHTNADKRGFYYLSAGILKAKGEYDLATVAVDSARRYQNKIENNQYLLDLMLLKASLCEKLLDKQAMLECIVAIDSVLTMDASLATSKNLAALDRIKLLSVFLESDTAMLANFAAYEASHAQLVKKKIDPKLVAALLDYNNEEQQYQIHQLSQSKVQQDAFMGGQSKKLKCAIGIAAIFSLLSGYLYRRNIIRKQSEATLQAEKIETERIALLERQQMKESVTAEKERLARAAETERQRLKAEQIALKDRVENIEQSKLELEKELVAKFNLPLLDVFTITTKTKVHKIKIDHLMYVVAENDGTRFYFLDKKMFLILSLKEVIRQLPDSHFVRIFRSTVVNVGFIAAVNSKYIVLENGEELAMSRTYREEVKRRVG